MKRKRHGTEEIIRKLREAEQLEAGGQSLAQVCQKLEISAATLARWRTQFRGMGKEVKRLRALEEENRRLKKAVADLTLDKQILKELNEGKWCARSAAARRSSTSSGRGLMCRPAVRAGWSGCRVTR